MKALVLGCEQNGLGVIRALSSKNVEVVAVDHNFFRGGIHSRYIKRRYFVTNITVNERVFLDEIIKIGQKESATDKVFLFPTSDLYLLSCATHWSELQNWFYPVFETNMDVLLNCLEKMRMYKIAHKADVPYPKTLYSPLNPSEDYPVSYPLVVKPGNRTIENSRKNVFRLRLCQNKKDLSDAVNLLEKLDVPFIVQEYIPGGDEQLYSAAIFSYKGESVASFTGRKLRQFPPKMGVCAYGEIVNETKIVDYAERFVKVTGYTGIAHLEFKKYNGEFYLMETNCRSWSWHSLATFSGVNLPWIGCEIIKTGKFKAYPQKRFKGTWSYFLMDLWYNVIEHRNVSLLTVFKQAWGADQYAFWSPKDPWPAFYSFLFDTTELSLRIVHYIDNRTGHNLKRIKSAFSTIVGYLIKPYFYCKNRW